MELQEAIKTLEKNGFLVEASTYSGHPFMRILWEKLMYYYDTEDFSWEMHIHSNDPSKFFTIDFDDRFMKVYRTSVGITGEFDTGRKLRYKTTGKNKWDVAADCAKFILSCINGERLN